MTPDERLKKIEALRNELRITRAHAASIVDQDEAAKNRSDPRAECSRRHSENAAGQQPSRGAQ